MPSTVTAEPVALANELRPVLLRLTRELRREVHSLGVTGGQVVLLARIRRTPGIGVSALAADEGVSPAAISVHIGRLTAAGLVARAPAADRRRVGLTVTTEGERVLRSVRSKRTAWLAARLRNLDSRSLEALEAAVPALTNLLDEDTH